MHFRDFPLKSYDKIRYSDTDRQGHVNNAKFSTFLETGRTELLYLYEGHPLHDDDGSFVIAKQELELISEIKWPGTVEIGTLISKVGNSSIGFQQALYQNDILVARANSVIVHVDVNTKRSKPLSEETKEILLKFYLESYLK